MGLWDEGLKLVLPGLLATLGTALAAPIVLPALAKIARPAAKEAIRLYYDLADDVREVVAQHKTRCGTTGGVLHHFFAAGGEELMTQGLEAGAEEAVAEETITEIVLEGIVEIL